MQYSLLHVFMSLQHCEDRWVITPGELSVNGVQGVCLCVFVTSMMWTDLCTKALTHTVCVQLSEPSPNSLRWTSARVGLFWFEWRTQFSVICCTANLKTMKWSRRFPFKSEQTATNDVNLFKAAFKVFGAITFCVQVPARLAVSSSRCGLSGFINTLQKIDLQGVAALTSPDSINANKSRSVNSSERQSDGGLKPWRTENPLRMPSGSPARRFPCWTPVISVQRLAGKVISWGTSITWSQRVEERLYCYNSSHVFIKSYHGWWR